MSRKVKDVVDWCGGPDQSGGGGTFSFSLCSFSAPTPSEAALGLRRPGERAHTQHTMPQLPPLVLSLSLSLVLFFFSRRVGWLSRLPTLTHGRWRTCLRRHPRADLPRPRIGAAAPRDRPGSRRLSRMQRRHIASPPARTPPHHQKLLLLLGDLNARNYATGAAPASLWRNSETFYSLINLLYIKNYQFYKC